MISINKYSIKILLIIFSIYLVTGLALPLLSLAADDPYGLGTAANEAGLTTTTPGGAGDIPKYLGRFAGGALALSGSIFLFLIVYGGILMMTAAGNQDKVKKGKDVIIWAIIGALILGGAYAITNLVFQVFT
ncbi:hypothetical protein ACFL2U_00325 [Patescibacteria group bacterium]